VLSTPRQPLATMSRRGTGSWRRTTHVEIGPPKGRGLAGPRTREAKDGPAPVVMVVRGGGRELYTSERGAVAEDEVSLEAGFDAARRLTRLTTRPETAWTETLLGERVGGGFRRALAEAAAPGEPGSLLIGVLDDLPAAVLISGYAWMRLARLAGDDPAALTPPEVLPKMTDLCSGWRAGGVAVESISAGRGVPVQDCPPATDLEAGDDLAWHATGILEQDWMRRRRCVDVSALADGTSAVWAMFRDTVAEAPGEEVVLHEYTVSMALGSAAGGHVVTAIDAQPRVLPFPECPSAAAAVRGLVGIPIGELSAAVPVTLEGISSCTHLNDLLRSVGSSVSSLVGRVRTAT